MLVHTNGKKKTAFFSSPYCNQCHDLYHIGWKDLRAIFQPNVLFWRGNDTSWWGSSGRSRSLAVLNVNFMPHKSCNYFSNSAENGPTMAGQAGPVQVPMEQWTVCVPGLWQTYKRNMGYNDSVVSNFLCLVCSYSITSPRGEVSYHSKRVEVATIVEFPCAASSGRAYSGDKVNADNTEVCVFP